MAGIQAEGILAEGIQAVGILAEGIQAVGIQAEGSRTVGVAGILAEGSRTVGVAGILAEGIPGRVGLAGGVRASAGDKVSVVVDTLVNREVEVQMGGPGSARLEGQPGRWWVVAVPRTRRWAGGRCRP